MNFTISLSTYNFISIISAIPQVLHFSKHIASHSRRGPSSSKEVYTVSTGFTMYNKVLIAASIGLVKAGNETTAKVVESIVRYTGVSILSAVLPFPYVIGANIATIAYHEVLPRRQVEVINNGMDIAVNATTGLIMKLVNSVLESETFVNAQGYLSTKATYASEKLPEVMESATNGLSQAGSFASEKLSDTQEYLKTAAAYAGEKLPEIMESATNGLSQAGSFASEQFSNAKSYMLMETSIQTEQEISELHGLVEASANTASKAEDISTCAYQDGMLTECAQPMGELPANADTNQVS